MVEGTTTAFYLSTNTTWDAGDLLLGSRAVPSLASGTTSTVATSSPTIPARTAPGAYYVLVRADDGAIVAEANEANNVNYTNVVVGPDLTVFVSVTPTSAVSRRHHHHQRHHPQHRRRRRRRLDDTLLPPDQRHLGRRRHRDRQPRHPGAGSRHEQHQLHPRGDSGRHHARHPLHHRPRRRRQRRPRRPRVQQHLLGRHPDHPLIPPLSKGGGALVREGKGRGVAPGPPLPARSIRRLGPRG